MPRRRNDYFFRVFGIFLIIAGIMSYLYPEVSYKRKEPARPLEPGRVSEVTVEVPWFVSVGSVAAGFILIYKSLKITKRGGSSRWTG